MLRAREISIHAPREGSDDRVDTEDNANLIMSIHAPREGSDSTSKGWKRSKGDFYPRSPRGERPPGAGGYCGAEPISIHAPREGSDGRE